MKLLLEINNQAVTYEAKALEVSQNMYEGMETVIRILEATIIEDSKLTDVLLETVETIESVTEEQPLVPMSAASTMPGVEYPSKSGIATDSSPKLQVNLYKQPHLLSVLTEIREECGVKLVPPEINSTSDSYKFHIKDVVIITDKRHIKDATAAKEAIQQMVDEEVFNSNGYQLLQIKGPELVSEGEDFIIKEMVWFGAPIVQSTTIEEPDILPDNFTI